MADANSLAVVASSSSIREAPQRLRATIVASPSNGTDLGRVIDRLAEREEALPFEMVAFIGAKLAASVSNLRPGRSLAREIHLDNVVIDPDGGLRLIPGRDGPVWDHAPHLAPECRALGAFSSAADVYALGVLLFALLTGERPSFRSRVPIDRLEQEDVPKPLLDLVARATHPDATQRPDDADTLATDLHTWLHQRPGGNSTILAELLARHHLLDDALSPPAPQAPTAHEAPDEPDPDPDETTDDPTPSADDEPTDEASPSVNDASMGERTSTANPRGRWVWLLVLLSIALVVGMMQLAEQPNPVAQVEAPQ